MNIELNTYRVSCVEVRYKWKIGALAAYVTFLLTPGLAVFFFLALLGASRTGLSPRYPGVRITRKAFVIASFSMVNQCVVFLVSKCDGRGFLEGNIRSVCLFAAVVPEYSKQ